MGFLESAFNIIGSIIDHSKTAYAKKVRETSNSVERKVRTYESSNPDMSSEKRAQLDQARENAQRAREKVDEAGW